MTIDFASILSSVWQILAVGIIFGAGLPAVFALGMRVLATTGEASVGPAGELRSGARPLWATVCAWVCFGLCIAVTIFGVVVIIFGKQLFG